MLTSSDTARLDAMMQRVMDRRLLRTSVPVRDEEMITRILKRGEESAAEQHRLLLATRSRSVGYIGITSQPPTKGSENLKTFSQIRGWKKRFNGA